MTKGDLLGVFEKKGLILYFDIFLTCSGGTCGGGGGEYGEAEAGHREVKGKGRQHHRDLSTVTNNKFVACGVS
jgi:hypothetical protein